MGIGSLEAPLAEPLENHATADVHTPTIVVNGVRKPSTFSTIIASPAVLVPYCDISFCTHMDSTKRVHEARGSFALRVSKLVGVANEPLKKTVLKWGRNLLDLRL